MGLSPTMPLAVAGQTIEPSVSVPMAAAQRLAATATRRSGAGPARVAVEHVRIAREAAAAAPAARRSRRAEVGPFAEIRLAEDDRAGRAQPRHEERVARRRPVRQARASRRWSSSGRRCRCCPSAGSGCRARARARRWLARSRSSASAMSSASGLSSITLLMRWPAAIDRLDALEVALGDGAASSVLPRSHRGLQLGDGAARERRQQWSAGSVRLRHRERRVEPAWPRRMPRAASTSRRSMAAEFSKRRLAPDDGASIECHRQRAIVEPDWGQTDADAGRRCSPTA